MRSFELRYGIMEHPSDKWVQMAVTCTRHASPMSVPPDDRTGVENDSRPGKGANQAASADGRSNREQLLLEYLPLVNRLAAKFLCSGKLQADLVEFGISGLVEATEKFDGAWGRSFTTFAIPVIIGQFKNYFRGHGWAVKVPGELQNRKRMVEETVDGLTQTLGRVPGVRDIVEHTGLSHEEVFEAFEAEGFAVL